MVRKMNPALLKPMQLTADLEAVIGKGPMPRSEVVKKLWAYIKKNDLQDATNRIGLKTLVIIAKNKNIP
jgi:chromatin remodeling complex protein RSC6